MENPVHFLRHKETSVIVGYDLDSVLDDWLENLKQDGWEVVTVPGLNVKEMLEAYESNKHQLELFEMDIVWSVRK